MQRFSRKLVRRLVQSTRLFSGNAIRLPNRQLVELKGPDGCGFLQGLITADVLSPTRVVQYGAFLNTQGRVLYDVLLYHMGNERVWLECCSDAVDGIVKHLKRYLLRAKVAISHVTGVDVYCAVQPVDGGKLIQAPDPRSSSIGSRLLVGSDQSPPGEGEGGGLLPVEYHRHRLRNGVPEGTKELPPAQCLPFEVNLDILNGISFTKGCYIGQELTSRTYHTGVLRKRLLPLTLKHSSVPANDIPWGARVTSSPESGSKNVGKIIGHCEDVALATLRLPNLKDDESLRVVLGDDTVVEAIWHKPNWWNSSS